MKIFRTTILILVLTTGFIFPSCDDDFLIDCDCSSIEPHFNIKNLEIQNTIRNANWFQVDLNETDSIEFALYEGIKLDYIVDYHSSINLNFSLMNSAMACTCLERGYGGSTTEKIESLDIITLNDFDAEHLAGSKINDLLTLSFFGRNNLDEKKTLNDFLAENTSFIEMEDILLTLEKSPELNPNFHVKVIFKLSTGEVYEAENRTIELL